VAREDLRYLLVNETLAQMNGAPVEGHNGRTGLGVQPPQASWGSILASADDHIRRAWWIAFFPGMALFATVVACNFVGEAARDALDPAAGPDGR